MFQTLLPPQQFFHYCAARNMCPPGWNRLPDGYEVLLRCLAGSNHLYRYRSLTDRNVQQQQASEDRWWQAPAPSYEFLLHDWIVNGMFCEIPPNQNQKKSVEVGAITIPQDLKIFFPIFLLLLKSRKIWSFLDSFLRIFDLKCT